MVLHDVLDDRQSEPRSTGVARARRIGAEEALEDAIDLILGNADALVGDRDLDNAVP